MKILWLCGNDSPYTYKKAMLRDADGSWVESLMKVIESEFSEIELSIAYISRDNKIVNENIDGIKFFSIRVSAKDKLFHCWKKKLSNRYDDILKIVKPDLIQVFGSETELGLIYKNTSVPIILHIQGVLNNCIRHWYPYNYSSTKELLSNIKRPVLFFKNLFFRRIRSFSICIEREILSNIHLYMGRTLWDHAVINEYSSNNKYYVCNEVLRSTFENAKELWTWDANRPLRLVSIMNDAVYKGLDTILYTARLLKECYKLDFEWTIVGLNNTAIAEEITHIKAETFNIVTVGRKNSRQILDLLMDATAYVHLSYIENSSNAVCEAQIVGIPVIATHVGGTASLIEHEENGILVPVNEPALVAFYISKLYKDGAFAEKIGKNGHDIAKLRHNSLQIAQRLVDIYTDVLQNS